MASKSSHFCKVSLSEILHFWLCRDYKLSDGADKKIQKVSNNELFWFQQIRLDVTEPDKNLRYQHFYCFKKYQF